jgi:hypothetical protein
MREKQVEAYLVREAKRHGYKAEKFTSPGQRSVPDRIVTGPHRTVFYVEVKAPGKKPTQAQLRDHARRRINGFAVYVIDSKAEVDRLFQGRQWFAEVRPMLVKDLKK